MVEGQDVGAATRMHGRKVRVETMFVVLWATWEDSGRGGEILRNGLSGMILSATAGWF